MVVTICGLKQNGCYNLWLQTELLLQSVASHTQLARLWKTPELTSMFHCVCSGKWHRRPWPCNSINVGPPCHLHPPQLISLPSPGSSTADVCSRRHVFQQVLVWASADSGVRWCSPSVVPKHHDSSARHYHHPTRSSGVSR